MGRSVETIIRDTLGNLQMQIIQLTAQLENPQPSEPPKDEPPKSDR